MQTSFNQIDTEKNTLLNQIKYQDNEITQLKAKLSSLEQTNLNLSSENAKMKNELITHQMDSQSFPKVKKTLEEKEAELEKITSLYTNLQREYRDYKVSMTNRYEKDVTLVKLQNENNIFKVENASKVEKFNDTLYNKILELENVIKNFSQEEKKKMDLLELQHQNKMASFKKKMLDYLKNEHSSYGKSTNQQNELNSKLTLLHVTELIKELEFQSTQIESLLREKEILKRKVSDMANDIKIHIQVENCLEEKNKKFQMQLHSISKPIKISKGPLKAQFESKANSPKKLIFDRKHNSTNSFSSKSSVISSSSCLEAGQKQIILTKELLSKEKEKENYRMKYETAQSKLNFLEKKYTNIYKLFDSALEKIYTEDIKEDIKDIFINLDEFKSCDFDKLNPEQRYGILSLLIKYMLPVVNQELTNSEMLKTKLSKVKQKYYFGNTSSIINNLNSTNIKHFYNNSMNFKANNQNDSYSTSLTSTDVIGCCNQPSTINLKSQTLGDFSYKIKKSKLRIEDTKLRLDTFSILHY